MIWRKSVPKPFPHTGRRKERVPIHLQLREKAQCVTWARGWPQAFNYILRDLQSNNEIHQTIAGLLGRRLALQGGAVLLG